MKKNSIKSHSLWGTDC